MKPKAYRIIRYWDERRERFFYELERKHWNGWCSLDEYGICAGYAHDYESEDDAFNAMGKFRHNDSLEADRKRQVIYTSQYKSMPKVNNSGLW